MIRAMTLLLALVASSDVAASEAWQATSERLEIQGRFEPHIGGLRIGVFQDWVLTLTDSKGEPVSSARISINGGMPGHGHGLPSQPEVTRYLGHGRYLVEGMLFNMSGDWVLTFTLATSEGQDLLAVRLDLDDLVKDSLTVLASMRLDSETAPPPSPSNRFADEPRAASFGEALFFDSRFSLDGTLSCASCHQPSRYFTDGKQRGEGVHRSGRNTPTVVGSAYQTWFYWDGRRDSLWSQALVPFEAADEMGSSRLQVIRVIANDERYRSAYEVVFGPLPDTVTATGLPEHAGPLGTSAMRDAWYRLPAVVRNDVNTAYVNVGKALEAYQRTLRIPRSRFDEYVDALIAGGADKSDSLTADEQKGLALWLDTEKTHCMRCHNGPRFTNEGFSNIGTGTFSGTSLDFGRVYGIRAVVTDEFNCGGPYSDAGDNQCAHLRFLNSSAHVPLEGAFKVPSLRNVAKTAPYMHDGRFSSLRDVIEHYRNPPQNSGDHELVPLELSDEEVSQLVSFIESLSAVPQ